MREEKCGNSTQLSSHPDMVEYEKSGKPEFSSGKFLTGGEIMRQEKSVLITADLLSTDPRYKRNKHCIIFPLY